jgi:hypothetical protein
MEWHDMPTIRAIVKQAKQDDYHFAALLMAIVKSAPFRMQQVPIDEQQPAMRAAATVSQ